MKTLTIIAMVAFFAMANLQSQAQDLANLNSNKSKENKKELKSEKKEIKKLEGPSVSIRSKNSFGVDFGNIPNVSWKRSKTFDEATFTKDGKRMTAYYDYYSKLVGTTSPRTFADIPLKAQNLIKTKYSDYAIGEVILYDDNEANETDMILWNTQFEDADHYFIVLSKGQKKIILMSDMDGQVSFFKNL